MLTRRSLLGAAATVAVTAGLTACTNDSLPEPRPAAVPGLDPTNWASLRAQFALSPDVANLATFVFASHPASVRAAIEKHRAELDRSPTRYLNEVEAALDDEVLAAASAYLQSKPDQIAFTDSTTMGLGLLYAGPGLRPGDEVLTTEHRFTPRMRPCGCAPPPTGSQSTGCACTTNRAALGPTIWLPG